MSYLPRKMLQVVASVFAVATFNFLLFHLIPGDPVRLIARTQKLDAESVANLRRQFGQWAQCLEGCNNAHGNLIILFSLRNHASIG